MSTFVGGCGSPKNTCSATLYQILEKISDLSKFHPNSNAKPWSRGAGRQSLGPTPPLPPSSCMAAQQPIIMWELLQPSLDVYLFPLFWFKCCSFFFDYQKIDCKRSRIACVSRSSSGTEQSPKVFGHLVLLVSNVVLNSEFFFFEKKKKTIKVIYGHFWCIKWGNVFIFSGIS